MANSTESNQALKERETDYSSKEYFDLMTKYWRAATTSPLVNCISKTILC
ncbi:xylulose-5-phosphate phosphoketolase [Lentilactobacillus farraginis DSM 18382 = JCM 14108]|uniref:Xylulose-5-phosphate phosphoketolase n=1 Tax=Lentilactobacillus farraginis DSM 18382 = JCM 14108 TaxID=1423743 RepID=X0PIC8_9LACO|nr:xylulose-5-phosphate phosphoketolase [Lentilactobacillus farraginis DSM 18382 = JCM 14108]